jgi:exopolysaccharide production protein ExoZ
MLMATERIDRTAGLGTVVSDGRARTLEWWCQGLSRIYELSDHPGRILSMEGVRGLAVIMVFFTHYHTLFGHYVSPQSFSFAVSRFAGTIGNAGVDLFFVLSGYLIYRAVIRKPINYVAFIRRRIERIYPTFLVILALYLVLSFVLPGESKIPRRPFTAAGYILANLILLPGIFKIQPIITVAWTLSFAHSPTRDL